MAAALSCLKCQAQMTPPVPGVLTGCSCAACGTWQEQLVFPALFSALKPGRAAEKVLMEGESACYFHPQKKAAVPCDLCGRFLCALCDLELNGQHLCSGCLSTARNQGKITSLDQKRFIPESAALTLAIVPILIWPVSLITAPFAALLAIRSFRAPGSLVESGRLRGIVALVFAIAEMAGWAFGAFVYISRYT